MNVVGRAFEQVLTMPPCGVQCRLLLALKHHKLMESMLSEMSCAAQAAKKRDFMTGSTIVHSEVRPSMLSSARLAFTQQYGEHAAMHHNTLNGAVVHALGKAGQQAALFGPLKLYFSMVEALVCKHVPRHRVLWRGQRVSA